ncbi:MAG: TIM barrel protein [Burkholderiales bacterium]|nr:TIM barrel protein [Burkholderiales bacterium]
MPRFAANLGFLFPELPFPERFGAAAAAGFAAVEFAQPWDLEAREIAELLEANGLELVNFNLPMGDKEAGDFGIACLPGREEEFREGVARAIAYAAVLGNGRVNCIAGKVPPGAEAALVRATLLANLRHAAREFRPAGLTLLLEPINTVDVPGFAVARPAEGAALLAEAGAPNTGLQYDIYHAAMMGEDPVEGLSRLAPVIRHVQFADAPGRHEPGTGRVDIAGCFARLDALGYEGWVAAEYRPSKATAQTLGWLA